MVIHPDSRPLFLPAAIVARGTCRCFGRRGPWLRPSSSSTRSTPWPAREEGKAQKTARENIPKSPERASDPTTHFPWCPRRLPPHPPSPPPAAGKHRTQSSPEAFQWDGTGNICGLKERGPGGKWGGEGGGQRTQTGGAQTLHCGRRQQMGRAGGPSVQRAVSFLAEAAARGRGGRKEPRGRPSDHEAEEEDGTSAGL